MQEIIVKKFGYSWDYLSIPEGLLGIWESHFQLIENMLFDGRKIFKELFNTLHLGFLSVLIEF